MAKISTYPSASSPQLSDMLIGSEVGDGNATKNFTIADIIGLANLGQYVPYTGAIADVDVTGYSVTADRFYGDLSANSVLIVGDLTLDCAVIDGGSSPGTLGQVFVSQGPYALWTTYGLQQVLTAGSSATASISLIGTIDASSVTAGVIIADTGFEVSGGLSEFYSTVQFYNNITLDARLIDGTGSAGTANQVLLSDGIGSVRWVTYDLQRAINAGDTAIGDINLTGNIVANEIKSNGELWVAYTLKDTSGNLGTPGEVLKATTGGSVTWDDLSLQDVLDAGDTATGDITLTGNIVANDIKSNDELWVVNTLKDGFGSIGTSGQVLKSTGLKTRWEDENSAVKYGVFYDNSIQVCTVGTPVAMRFNQEVAADGVFIGADGSGNLSWIQVNQKGTYNIQFSAQVERSTGGGAEKIDIWFRLEGSDLPWSNTQLTMQSNSSFVVASWNIISDIDVGQRFQIMWHQTGGSIRLVSAAAQTGPVRPATPSTILTVTQVA